MNMKRLLIVVFLLLSMPVQAGTVGFQSPERVVRKAEVIGEFEIVSVQTRQLQCSTRAEYVLSPIGTSFKGHFKKNAPLSFYTSSYIQGAQNCPMLILMLPPTATELQKGKKLIATLIFDQKNKTYTVTGTFDLDKKSEIQRWLHSR